MGVKQFMGLLAHGAEQWMREDEKKKFVALAASWESKKEIISRSCEIMACTVLSNLFLQEKVVEKALQEARAYVTSINVPAAKLPKQYQDPYRRDRPQEHEEEGCEGGGGGGGEEVAQASDAGPVKTVSCAQVVRWCGTVRHFSM